jgi:hypothetical protein
MLIKRRRASSATQSGNTYWPSAILISSSGGEPLYRAIVAS